MQKSEIDEKANVNRKKSNIYRKSWFIYSWCMKWFRAHKRPFPVVVSKKIIYISILYQIIHGNCMAILYKKLILTLGKIMVVVQFFDCNIIEYQQLTELRNMLCGVFVMFD